MRIAHLTLLHGFNYGGILQAYATQKILRDHGHEVVTLDYHTAKRIILARKLTLNIRFIHEKIRWLLDTWQFSGVKEFNDFRARHFQFSASCCNARQLTRACRGFDAVAVGSDQVWSPSWVRPPFFLDFDLEPACKRISLAACCGQPTDDPDFLRYFAKTISRFDALSVRNEFTAEMVRKATGRTAEVVFDPTLATDFPGEPVPGISGPYILVYVINRGDSVPLAMEAYRRIKAATGLPVFCIPPAETKDDSALPVDRVIRRITPFQWNHLIANASHVITDSFHGAIFAAKHHRNFIALDSGFKAFERIRTFLAMAGLDSRILRDGKELAGMDAVHADTDWDATDAKIAGMAARYHAFVASLSNV